MKLYLTLLTVTISLLAFSCKTTKRVTNLEKEEVRFSLSKGPCFGNCPSYNLSINQGGYATYEGISNSDKIGIYGKQITDDQFESLEKAFESSDFASLPTSITSQIADLPSITVGYNNGESYKEVTGKENRPEQLLQLQFMLEKIADSGDWKLLKSAQEINNTKKPEIVTLYNEVIIEPIPGTLIAKWIESNSKYKVRLLKKIAPTLNLYLITYDSDVITPEKFLNAMKRDENIKSAEFNKKTSKRGR